MAGKREQKKALQLLDDAVSECRIAGIPASQLAAQVGDWLYTWGRVDGDIETQNHIADHLPLARRAMAAKAGK